MAASSEARQAGREKKEEEEERLRKTARELYNDPSVRLTNGLVFGQGGGVLNNGLLDATRARIEANDEAAAVTANERKKKVHEKKEQVELIRESTKKRFPPATSEKSLNDEQLAELSRNQLVALVQYKKNRKDGKCPTKKPELIVMLREQWNRPSPAPSPYNSDVEEEDGADGIPMDDEALRHCIDANRVCRKAPRKEDNGSDEGNLSSSDDDDDGEE